MRDNHPHQHQAGKPLSEWQTNRWIDQAGLEVARPGGKCHQRINYNTTVHTRDRDIHSWVRLHAASVNIRAYVYCEQTCEFAGCTKGPESIKLHKKGIIGSTRFYTTHSDLMRTLIAQNGEAKSYWPQVTLTCSQISWRNVQCSEVVD